MCEHEYVVMYDGFDAISGERHVILGCLKCGEEYSDRWL